MKYFSHLKIVLKSVIKVKTVEINFLTLVTILLMQTAGTKFGRLS